jgi:NAD(P)H-flavin reductase
MLPRPFRVIGSRLDTDDTVTLSLEPLDGDPLEFEAGQFTMLHAFGVGEVPISISGDPTWPGPLVHTIRDVGNVTHALVTAQVGAIVGVRGPYGTGWRVGEARGGDVVLAAGGIGLAPLRPALWEIADRREDFGRVVLLYGARSPSDVLFAQDLERWADECAMDVEITVDYGPPTWNGRVGPVTKLLSRAGFDPPRTTALLCGPEIMMTLSVNALLGRGVPADRLRLSMERNMKCGVGLCGHCQLREFFICVDGPVLDYERLAPLLDVWEL